jgi:hypothetical protein
MWKIIFAESHTEHHWRCSKGNALATGHYTTQKNGLPYIHIFKMQSLHFCLKKHIWVWVFFLMNTKLCHFEGHISIVSAILVSLLEFKDDLYLRLVRNSSKENILSVSICESTILPMSCQMSFFGSGNWNQPRQYLPMLTWVQSSIAILSIPTRPFMNFFLNF